MLATIQHLFQKAIWTVLLARDNVTKQYYHIFSVIELQPKEMANYGIPNGDWFQNKMKLSTYSSQSSDYSFSLVILPFDSVEQGIQAFGEPSAQFIDGEKIQFFNDIFLREPAGENPLTLEDNTYQKDGLLAVIPKHKSGSLLWSQIDYKRTTENKFKGTNLTNNMKAMSQLTFDWLGFDIWTIPEHIGNMYLNAANPYYRKLDLTLSNKPDGILYHFFMREGVTEKLSIRIIDKHGDYVALDKRFELDGPIGFILLPHEPNNVELYIYNQTDQLIGLQGSFGFVKAINFDMQVKQTDFNVQDNKGKRKFTTEKYSSGPAFKIVNNDEVNLAYYFKSAENSRKHIKLEESKEFVFLPAAHSDSERIAVKEKAVKLIKDIINGARDTCMLCDPYFAANEVIDYLYTIKNSGVKIQVLNRRGSGFIDNAKAADLLEAIKTYNSQPFQKIECRMLTQNLLHDRFIIVDKNVWFIGSSFNEIGSRATCIGKVPESTNIEVIKEMEKWFYNDQYTETVESFLASSTNA